LIVELGEEVPDNVIGYEVLIQKPTKKRGLDANALSWVLIDRIASNLHVSRDEVYGLMLERYGVATYLIVKPNEADKILEVFEHGRKLGDIKINNQIGTQLQIFIGSSHYNKSEFSTYLQGIISECENMGLVIENKDVFFDAIAHWSI
jgi:hypothetical protein